MSAVKETITEAVQKAARDGRLTCEAAHDLVIELGVSLQEIGAICNELHIKIKECQLGCF